MSFHSFSPLSLFQSGGRPGRRGTRRCGCSGMAQTEGDAAGGDVRIVRGGKDVILGEISGILRRNHFLATNAGQEAGHGL